MGTAGVEGFGPSCSRLYLKDTIKNESIRYKDNNARHNDIFSPYNENLYLIDISAGAGKLHQRQEVTEVVVDDVSSTEGQSQDASSVDHGTKKPHQV